MSKLLEGEEEKAYTEGFYCYAAGEVRRQNPYLQGKKTNPNPRADKRLALCWSRGWASARDWEIKEKDDPV